MVCQFTGPNETDGDITFQLAHEILSPYFSVSAVRKLLCTCFQKMWLQSHNQIFWNDRVKWGKSREQIEKGAMLWQMIVENKFYWISHHWPTCIWNFSYQKKRYLTGKATLFMIELTSLSILWLPFYSFTERIMSTARGSLNDVPLEIVKIRPLYFPHSQLLRA